MAKCPNCGREAARTIDWVCQWCGYPLPNGSFKKIKKTFKELKEESLSVHPTYEEKEIETAPPPPPQTGPQIKPVQAHIEAAKAPEPAPQAPPQPVRMPQLEAQATSERPPAPVKEAPPPQTPQPVRSEAPPPAVVTPPESKPVEQVKQPEPAAEAKTAPPPEVKHEPSQPDIELTVAELLTAYETDGVAADAKFGNKNLRITGIVDKINVKEALNIYSIILNSPKKSILLQGVRCVFDRDFGNALNSLSTGQTVTVQGKYTGSMIDISLRDCFLVK